MWIWEILRKGGKKVDKAVIISMGGRDGGIDLVNKYGCNGMVGENSRQKAGRGSANKWIQPY